MRGLVVRKRLPAELRRRLGGLNKEDERWWGVSEQLEQPCEVAAEEDSIYSQLAKAQAEFLEIKKTKEGQIGNLKFHYAPLDEVYASTRPFLNKFGIFHNHVIEEVDQYNTRVSCALHYKSTTILPCTLIAHHEGDAASKGKSITYMSRYTYQRAIGVIGEEDIDAQGLTDKPKPQQASGDGKQRRTEGGKKRQDQTAPKTEQPSTDAQPQSFTWEQFKNSIDRAKNPARLVTFVDKCGTMQQLIDDQELMQQVFDHAANVLKEKREAGTWSAEECEFLSKRLAHNYNALVMEHDAAKPPLTFETISGQIDGIIKPQGLVDYLERAESSEALLADITLTKRLIEKAGQTAYARLQGGKWNAADVDQVEAVLAKLKLKVEGAKPDTSGEQGELINE